MPEDAKSKILLIENSGADFYNSRLRLAIYLQDSGFDVSALVPDDGFIDLIEKSGIRVFHYNMERSNKGIFQTIRLIRIYKEIIKKEKFDLIHSFRFQPNVITSFASLLLPSKIVLHITGLGIAYANKSIKYLILRSLSQALYFFKFLVCDLIIVQNPDDIKSLWFTRFNPKKVKLVPGSGVDLDLFKPEPETRELIRKSYGLLDHDLLFICVTRLLWEKGIKELTEAFSDLQKVNNKIKLFIVGWSDEDNPRHIPYDFINFYKDNNNILFVGKQINIQNLLCASDVFIYPSYYREGIPRGILEALATGLPIITTNTPGCNMTVNEGFNGYLIKPRSVKAIFNIVKAINEDPQKLKTMGKNSRSIAQNFFKDTIVYNQIKQLYEQQLKISTS